MYQVDPLVRTPAGVPKKGSAGVSVSTGPRAACHPRGLRTGLPLQITLS